MKNSSFKTVKVNYPRRTSQSVIPIPLCRNRSSLNTCVHKTRIFVCLWRCTFQIRTIAKTRISKIEHARLQNILIRSGDFLESAPSSLKKRLRGSAQKTPFLTEKLTVIISIESTINTQPSMKSILINHNLLVWILNHALPNKTIRNTQSSSIHNDKLYEIIKENMWINHDTTNESSIVTCEIGQIYDCVWLDIPYGLLLNGYCLGWLLVEYWPMVVRY